MTARVPSDLKRVAVVLAVVGLVLLGAILSVSRAGAYAVEVDGKAIGYVRSSREVSKAVQEILAEARRVWPPDLEIMSNVDVKPAKTGNGGAAEAPEFLSEEQLRQKLREALRFSANAYVVQVDGNDIVALRDGEDAHGIIEEIRSSYTEGVTARGKVKLEEIRILQDVQVVEKRVPVDSIREPEEAKQILLRGTDKTALYVVQKGDTLWTIARARGMTVDQLRKANPQLKGDALQVGQTLNLIVPEPYITLVSVETATLDVPIPFQTEVIPDQEMWPWQQVVKQRGIPGYKEVVVEIHRKDGREVQRRILSEKIISEPVKQVVVRGSKLVPDLGTGQFAWPSPGSITSRYGYRRSGFHHGVDIAAPVGTPVIAADSGTVTFSGWLPYYGIAVMIDHGGGKIVTVYGHLSKTLVKVGQTVKRGQVIGNVGSTGRSTGPHLHFEIRVDGKPQDPLNYYPK